MTDAKLLKDIALAQGQDADPAASQALGKLYERHATWLCQRIGRTARVRTLALDDAIQDVVHETFYRAYVGARTFNHDMADDPRRVVALVRGWLRGIATHVMADMQRRSAPTRVAWHCLDPRPATSSEQCAEPRHATPLVKALRAELEKLSPLQRDILAAAELYYQPERTQQRLPSGVAKMIARKHGTSSENVRQVRRRTMARLRSKLLPLMEGRV